MTTEIIMHPDLDGWFKGHQLSIDIRNSNKPKTFTNLKAFRSFIQTEVDFWGQLANKHGRLVEIRNYFISILSDIDNAISNANSANIANAINILTNAANKARSSDWRALYSVDPLSKMIAKHVEENPESATPIIDYLNGGQIYSKTVPYWVGLIDFVLSTSSGTKNLLQKSVEAEKQALADIRDAYLGEFNTLHSDYDEKEKEIRTQVDEFKNGLSSWEKEKTTGVEEFLKKNEEELGEIKLSNEKEMGGIIATYEKEFAELKLLYENHISLKAPAVHWGVMKKNYFWQGIIWIVVTTILSLCFIYYLNFTLNHLSSWVVNVVNKDNSAMIQNVKGTLIFALIVSTAAFIIRLFIRLAISAFHLSRDANERLQLTTVYLALLKENDAIMDGERSIVLQAIFSRADTGLLKGDSSPSMPSPIDTIITQATKAK